MNIIPSISEKCKGAMLGTAIGDALGWPNEPRAKNTTKNLQTNDSFVKWERNNRNPRWHKETIYPGEYSDDTQMTLSVARSIITGNWEKFFTEKELPYWLNYERGGGGALLKAAKCYKNKAIPPWEDKISKDYFNAGGNGAVMRILPHVIAFANRVNINELMKDIIQDALFTHGHPRAVLGATCYGFLLEYLLRKDSVLGYGELVDVAINGETIWGEFPEKSTFGNWLDTANKKCEYEFYSEWINTRNRMVEKLKLIRTSLKKGLVVNDKEIMTKLNCFDRTNGAGDVAVLAAIYLASKYANNPILGIKVPAFSFGTDTDTIASITGGLLGMINGTSWIPIEWSFVQDYNCLTYIVDLLLAKDKKAVSKESRTISTLGEDGWISTPIGKMKLMEVQEVPNGKNGFVIIKKWESLLGQTFYMKEFMSFNPVNGFNPKTQKSNNQSNKRNDKLFKLEANEVSLLIDDSSIKKNITFGKVLRIINYLIDGNKTHEQIAKELRVEIVFIDRINTFIKRNQ